MKKGKQGNYKVKSMKKTIIIFGMFIFCTALYAVDLTGSWTATVEYNRLFDTYKISLSAAGRCTVEVSNNNAKQETEGNWSYDGTYFKLNAVFRTPKISYLHNIAWESVLAFSDNNNSFNILGKAAANGPQTRITFYRSGENFGAAYNDKAIPQIFNTLTQNIPLRSRVAVVGVASPDSNEAEFYLNELTLNFVNSKKYTVVDRSDIDKVLAEQNFQMTGYVADDAYVSIGKFIGASIVVTGSVSGSKSQKRLVIKAIDVLTSEILGMASFSLGAQW